MRLRPIRLALLCRLQSTSRGSSIYQKSLSLLGKDGFTACLCSPTCITGLQEMMKTTRGTPCFCRARKGHRRLHFRNRVLAQLFHLSFQLGI
ncbi:unnamed protein product [Musa acuminata subsp. burmannicoides]